MRTGISPKVSLQLRRTTREHENARDYQIGKSKPCKSLNTACYVRDTEGAGVVMPPHEHSDATGPLIRTIITVTKNCQERLMIRIVDLND